MKFSKENFFVSEIAFSPIKTFISNLFKAPAHATRLMRSFVSERAQLGLTIALVLILILAKAQNQNQDIVGSVVRHYTEETSASIIPTDTPAQVADINSLMGPAANSIGQGGDGHDPDQDKTETPYTFRSDSVQAVLAVSNDYLDDYKPNKVTEYTVQPGDALSFIASDFGITSESILWANNLKSADTIKPGQILRIPPVSGVIHTIQKGETLSSIAQRYHADAAKILAFNELDTDASLTPGLELVIPDGTVSVASAPVSIAKNSVPASFRSSIINVAQRFAYLPDLGNFFKAPATGFDWGIVHDRNGVDIANACGTPIYAAADGTVSTALSSGWNGGFGRYIKIGHDNGTETLYGHLSKLLVAAGSTVTKGEEIGLMGTTGHSTGCHLHFEVHGARNPLAKY